MSKAGCNRVKSVKGVCSDVVLAAREKLGHVRLHCTFQDVREAVKALILYAGQFLHQVCCNSHSEAPLQPEWGVWGS